MVFGVWLVSPGDSIWRATYRPDKLSGCSCE